MKYFPRAVLVFYALFLLWLTLFKTSVDFASVLMHYQSRSLNLIPFAGFSPSNAREMLDNLFVFIPLGLLLGANLRHVDFGRKLTIVFGFSAFVEALQYAFAIGTTDVTDVIMNTIGGLLGLALYGLVGKHVDNKKLDQGVSVALMAVLLLFLYLRFCVFRVRY